MRLRHATTMETGLFEIQANHLSELRQARRVLSPGLSRSCLCDVRAADLISYDRDPESHGITNATVPSFGPKSAEPALDTTADLAHCFLRLANLPNFALDRLSRYEAALWR